jgi:hypothetical protein
VLGGLHNVYKVSYESFWARRAAIASVLTGDGFRV